MSSFYYAVYTELNCVMLHPLLCYPVTHVQLRRATRYGEGKSVITQEKCEVIRA